MSHLRGFGLVHIYRIYKQCRLKLPRPFMNVNRFATHLEGQETVNILGRTKYIHRWGLTKLLLAEKTYHFDIYIYIYIYYNRLIWNQPSTWQHSPAIPWSPSVCQEVCCTLPISSLHMSQGMSGWKENQDFHGIPINLVLLWKFITAARVSAMQTFILPASWEDENP